MRMMKGNRALWSLGATAIGVCILTGIASADVNDVSTERSGSIIVFPKVVWDGTRDTVVKINNISNQLVQAHCFYVNAAPANPGPPSVTNPPQCNETDFDLILTRQQPTHWVVSEGRFTSVGFGNDSSGISPGLVPPVPFGFIGELKCIQVNPDDGSPLRGNALKGEANLVRLDGDVAAYNAIALHGNTDMSVQDGASIDDLVLDLTGPNPNFPANPAIPGSQPGTPGNNGMYSACPDTLIVDHISVGAQDLVLAGSTLQPGIGDCDDTGGCPVTSELTVVTCNEDFDTQTFKPVTLGFNVWNEFEQRLSGSFTLGCFAELPLEAISPDFTQRLLGTFSAHARFTPNPGNGGVLGILEEVRHLDQASPASGQAGAAVAANLHFEGNRFDAATDGVGTPVQGATDHIIIPAP